MEKKELKPALVFEQFAKINEIPRPSKHEENMIEYLKEFGKSHQLETLVDETGNVLIRKAATPGYENADTIILQSHMDKPRRVGVKGPSPPAPSVLSIILPWLWAVTVMPPSTWQTMRFRSSYRLPSFFAWMAAMPF